MSFAPDIRSRLDALAARKKRVEQLREDVESGALEGVRSAAYHFRNVPVAPQLFPLPASLVSPHSLTPEHGAFGRLLVRRIAVTPDATEGPRVAAECWPAPDEECFPPSAIPLLAAGVAAPRSASRIAFLDTETTGLNGSTGTVAFLVGLGWWERGADGHWQFLLEQYLMEDFCHEGELMRRLVERLREFDLVCTYNGRCYDMPLLRARAAMNRQPPSLLGHGNVDLLFGARRIWKESFGSVSLKNVERRLLGIDRGPDIDGAMIPGVFFDFARNGQSALMPAVLDHNAQDIVSLGLLLRAMVAVARSPFDSGWIRRAEEWAGVARWLESRGETDAAAEAWRRACEGPAADPARLLAYRQQRAMLHKRCRDWSAAVVQWRALVELPLAESQRAWVELAKYLEHTAREWDAALDLVRRCLRQAEIEGDIAMLRAGAPPPHIADLRSEMQRREERLLRKISLRRHAA